MSKVSKARESQEYVGPGESPMCSNCKNFTSEQSKGGWNGSMIERNLRCTLGAFAVKKTAYCKEHSPT